ncbi:hypothetical protein [Janthinobacterium sp. B9-8]|uniref:hypothetical protein n=1 Tax=Janthinobacterium sp. B9-8 TaxID=1236179 RepID=UPI00061CE8BA|nr:hypothetical protein [Janthinobacterium sp. B9-8]AMC34792.1 hypothetical protein VN23_09305 [Janthinobacterium sp. B9-8]
MTIYDHTWLKAEWERMGKPERQYLDPDSPLLGWEDVVTHENTWFEDLEYRIKSKPYINWDHVSDKFNWIAEDDDGEACLYRGEPSRDNYSWFYQLFEFQDVGVHKSFTQGTCDWKDSLVMRPVVRRE